MALSALMSQVYLQVDKPEQYGFHPDRLLLRMSELLLRLAEGTPFVAAVAEEPDYDEGILRSVRARLLQKQLGEYGVAARLDALMQQASQTLCLTVALASSTTWSIQLSCMTRRGPCSCIQRRVVPTLLCTCNFLHNGCACQ